jgi:hypothetical protein
MTDVSEIYTQEELAKISTAKSIIQSKVEYLKKMVPRHYDNMFLSGGAIASLLQYGSPKDWDVYFKDSFTQKSVVDFFVLNHPDEVAIFDEKYRDAPVGAKAITENATTLKNGIQLITKHTGTPELIRESFDFVHCKPYYDFGKDKLFISKEQFDLCCNKKLKINNMKAQTIYRQTKFEQRGYTWP